MKIPKKPRRVQVPIRMYEPLRAELEKSARERGSSMNAEIVRRLEQSFFGDLAEDDKEALRARVFDEMQERLDSTLRGAAEVREAFEKTEAALREIIYAQNELIGQLKEKSK